MVAAIGSCGRPWRARPVSHEVGLVGTTTSDLLRDPVAMARVNAGVDEGDVEVSSPTGMIDESAE
jgi:hypothetical protein